MNGHKMIKKPDGSRYHNLQIQANKQSQVTSVKKLAPKTVAGPVEVGTTENLTAKDVRERFLDKVLF
jgi:hypothetical protein